MTEVLLELIWYNLISPIDFVVAPIRVLITAGAVDTLPWGIVLVIAATCNTLGFQPAYWSIKLAAYLLKRWKIAHPPKQHRAMPGWLIPFYNFLARWRKHKFVWQVILNSVPYLDWGAASLAVAERYPYWRYLVAALIGRCLHNLPVVLGGLWLTKQDWFQVLVRGARDPLTTIIVILTVVIATVILFFNLRRNGNTQVID